jgi:hypothetical protein
MPPYDYSSLSSYGNPFPLTQPVGSPNWYQTAPVTPRTFPVATANGAVAQPAFNFDTDMAGLMPTNAPLGLAPTNAGIMQSIDPGNAANPSIWQSLKNWGTDSGFLSTRDANGMQTQGWGGLALGAAQGLGSLYLGMQQYNLAKDTLANSKAQFERNFAANKATTNARLEDRQRARIASNAGAYQSVGDYMDKYGVK